MPGLTIVVGQPHLAGHLAEVAVAEDDHRVAVLEGELEGEHASGRASPAASRARATMAWVLPWPRPRQASLMSDCSGAMLPRPGPAAHDVDEDARHLGADHVGDPLEHQAEARGRGEGHRAQAGAAAAVHHVDGGDLADRLEEDAVELGQQLRHQLGALGGRGDRVAEEVAAAGEQRADRGGVGALDDERLASAAAESLVGMSTGSGARRSRLAEELRRVLELEVEVRPGSGARP